MKRISIKEGILSFLYVTSLTYILLPPVLFTPRMLKYF